MRVGDNKIGLSIAFLHPQTYMDNQNQSHVCQFKSESDTEKTVKKFHEKFSPNFCDNMCQRDMRVNTEHYYWP